MSVSEDKTAVACFEIMIFNESCSLDSEFDMNVLSMSN